MVSVSRNILRTILIISYILIIALIISGVSALFSYLNTGADRSSMLHTEIKKVDQYLPKITWSPLNNEGRLMDTENLNALQNNYLDAWYIKHIAYKTNKTAGIKDYYTDNARKNLFDFIELNKAQGITIESTTLEHHPTLEFFSEDGQLAVITDKDVVEYKRVFKNDTLVVETTEISTYKMVFLLEDGFWRTRHLVRESTKHHQVNHSKITLNNFKIKGINYYPQASPWNMFGAKFDLDIISKDFNIIKTSGLNTIRVFVPYDNFGKAKVDLKKLDQLKATLDAAKTNNLKVIITLFDFYGDYSVLNWTLNQRHAETIVTALKNHDALLAWDIKNEPNLDFKSRGKENVIAWLNTMIDLVKSADHNHPVTIGWNNIDSAPILKDKLDFISFHYYESLDLLDEKYKLLKTKITNKTIVLGEYGMSSYKGFWKPIGNNEDYQAEFHKKAQNIFIENDIAFISWTLYDFIEIPKEVVGRLPWRKRAQEHFGFINQNGETKPAFKYISGE